ncbi:MAG: glycosyltransferase family 4 protein [Bacteroidales bacterium]|nr:glycosyltransferase family 4 protein [Bacteroidales bacterium]
MNFEPFVYPLIIFLLINLYFLVAERYGVVDRPNDRSSHDRLVLRGGGIILPAGIALWFFWSGFQYPWFFMGLMIVSLFSFLDDLSGVRFWIRLLVHFTAVALLLYQLEYVTLAAWIWIIALIVATGAINAFNFMDGINGITAGDGISVLAGFWLLNTIQVPFIGNGLLYATTIALLIFAFYNFRPRARCFAGDVGSVSLSYILVFLLGKLIITTGNPLYLMFFCLYGLDTFMTICTRLVHHENVFNAHRQHLYQRLANEGQIPHLIVSSGYTLVQLMINLTVITAARYLSLPGQILVSALILLVLTYVYLRLKSKYLVKKLTD